MPFTRTQLAAAGLAVMAAVTSVASYVQGNKAEAALKADTSLTTGPIQTKAAEMAPLPDGGTHLFNLMANTVPNPVQTPARVFTQPLNIKTDPLYGNPSVTEGGIHRISTPLGPNGMHLSIQPARHDTSGTVTFAAPGQPAYSVTLHPVKTASGRDSIIPTPSTFNRAFNARTEAPELACDMMKIAINKDPVETRRAEIKTVHQHLCRGGYNLT